MQLEDAYDILLLPFGSTLKDVKRAYRTEALLVHPDKLGDVASEVRAYAEERFKVLNDAYRSLNDYIAANGIPPAPALVHTEPAFSYESSQNTSSSSEESAHPPRNPAEAWGEFMAREYANEYRRRSSDSQKTSVIFGVLFLLLILFRSCEMYGYYNRHERAKPPEPTPTEQPIDTEEGR